MIFGLSFSACADAVTTGGVTAVVTPRPVDSLGNEKQVEFATSAKAETTTTETTTKPAYNQEEMKKDLEELGKEDMAASTIGIFAWVTIGSLLLLWLVLKVGIDAVMWIVFLELVLFIGFGVVRIQGMSVLKFITSNSTQKRPYNSKGVFNNVDNREIL